MRELVDYIERVDLSGFDVETRHLVGDIDESSYAGEEEKKKKGCGEIETRRWRRRDIFRARGSH